MMKSSDIKWLVISLMLLLLFFNPVFGQSDSVLLQINTDHLEFKKDGMTVLGGWAIGNLAASGFMMTRTRGVDYHFHEMNVFWNVVNLGIAGGAYYGANSTDVSAMSLLETFESQKDFGSILLLNAGLDVAYVMSGVYLRERSKHISNHQNRLKGYGNSLILQGSFLLGFDLILYGLNERSINNWLDVNNLALNFSPGGLALSWFFN
jgi:hypothetical protein